MKTPPLKLFPLHSIDDHRHHGDPEFEHERKHFAYWPTQQQPQQPASTHWLTTVMNATGTNQHPCFAAEASPRTNKGSLAFILASTPAPAPSIDFTVSSPSGSETESDHEPTAPLPVTHHTLSLTKRRRAQPPVSPDHKKGSKYCIVDGCTSRAKHARKCWRHGGSVKCKVPECINRAKSKGVCWSHGGGTICSHPECETIAVSHGFCWAHGGGKRCQIDGCSRPAYERTDNFCTTHHKQRLRAAANKHL